MGICSPQSCSQPRAMPLMSRPRLTWEPLAGNVVPQGSKRRREMMAYEDFPAGISETAVQA